MPRRRPPDTYLHELRALAGSLRGLREAAGLNQDQLGEQIGRTQPQISKIERAKQRPTTDEIRAWAAAAGADSGVLDGLLAQLDRSGMEYKRWEQQYREAGGPAGKQADIGRLEAATSAIGKYCPASIPSQLMTARYMEEYLRLPCGPLAHGATDEQVAEMISARMRRQQILYQPGKHISIVILEAALYTLCCSAETMAGQLDRMLSLDSLPSLELGIIPFSSVVPVWPLSGFVIYDDQFVVVETITGEQQLSEPQEVAKYAGWLKLLRETAVTGRDAVHLIQRAITAQASET